MLLKFNPGALTSGMVGSRGSVSLGLTILHSFLTSVFFIRQALLLAGARQWLIASIYMPCCLQPPSTPKFRMSAGVPELNLTGFDWVTCLVLNQSFLP